MSTLQTTILKHPDSASNNIQFDNGGRVGIGSSSPSSLLHLASNAPHITFEDVDNNQDWQLQATAWFALRNQTTSSELLRVDADGDVNVRSGDLNFTDESASAPYPQQIIKWSNDSTTANGFYISQDTERNGRIWHEQGLDIVFGNNNTDTARFDSAGRLLIGLTSSFGGGLLQASHGSGANLSLARDDSGSTVNGNSLGQFGFWGNAGGTYDRVGRIICSADGNHSSTSKPSTIRFYTTPSAEIVASERMRITADGDLRIGQTTTSQPGDNNNTQGLCFRVADGQGANVGRFYASSGADHNFNRTSDGVILAFRSAGTNEGAVSISGTTVTYGGGHLARWSQLLNNADPSEILKGTVMSNLDEMCEWGEEDNEQLNRTKISDVEGDSNVAGVFVSTSFNEEGPYDFYVGMTGDMIIRIAEGVTVQRGDLLMSAGDGTAKPQDDDIVRGLTVAKVISTNVTCTYEDGSYCVPCVLMAC